MSRQTTELAYPLLGAQGVRGEDALRYHGRWRVVNEDDEVLPDDDSSLASISVSICFGNLVLQAPGMLRLDIPLDVIEDDPSVILTLRVDGVSRQVVDEGPVAAAWISKVVGKEARIVKCLDPES